MTAAAVLCVSISHCLHAGEHEDWRRGFQARGWYAFREPGNRYTGGAMPAIYQVGYSNGQEHWACSAMLGWGSGWESAEYGRNGLTHLQLAASVSLGLLAELLTGLHLGIAVQSISHNFAPVPDPYRPVNAYFLGGEYLLLYCRSLETLPLTVQASLGYNTFSYEWRTGNADTSGRTRGYTGEMSAALPVAEGLYFCVGYRSEFIEGKGELPKSVVHGPFAGLVVCWRQRESCCCLF